MARRILDRRELREQADEAERREAAVADSAGSEAVAPAEPGKAKKPAAAKARKPRPKKAPPRLCARWGVFDAAMKQVAVFDYNQRAAAEEKLAGLLARQKGTYFLQIVKEPLAEPAPAAAPPAGPRGGG
jgi:hypothetical protein